MLLRIHPKSWTVINDHKTASISPFCEGNVLSDSDGRYVRNPLDSLNTFCSYFYSFGDITTFLQTHQIKFRYVHLLVLFVLHQLIRYTVPSWVLSLQSTSTKSSVDVDGISSMLLKQVVDGYCTNADKTRQHIFQNCHTAGTNDVVRIWQ